MREIAEVRIVAPQTTADTEGHTNFYGHLFKEANCKANIDQAIDKYLHPGSSLKIPDIKIDYTDVCMLEIVNNP